MKTNSIQLRLLIAINLLVLSSLAFTAYVSFLGAMHELDEIYDAQLARNARFIGVLFENNALTNSQLENIQQPLIIHVPELLDDGVERTSAQERFTIGHKYESKIAFQVWQNDNLIMTSENAEFFPHLIKQQGFHEISEQGTRWITYHLPFPEQNIWVATGQREDVREEISQHLALAEIQPILLMLLPLNIIIYLLIKLFLRPLTLLERLVAEKSPEQLTEIHLPQPKELKPIKAAINQLIRRVNYHLHEEKRFVSDAAHELRTPLSILQLHAQNLLSPTFSNEDKDSQIKFILEGSQRITHLVNQLLVLNKLNSIQSAHTKQINLYQLLQDSLSDLPLAALEKIQWQLILDDNLVIWGDEVLLRAAFRNLLDNASKYSPANAEVTIQASQLKQQLMVSMSNTVEVMPDIDKMLERFFRQPHHQHIEGSGLGLSIVKRIIELHQGDIYIEQPPQNMFNRLNVNLLFPK